MVCFVAFWDDSSCSLLKIPAKGIKNNGVKYYFRRLYHLFPDVSKEMRFRSEIIMLKYIVKKKSWTMNIHFVMSLNEVKGQPDWLKGT